MCRRCHVRCFPSYSKRSLATGISSLSEVNVRQGAHWSTVRRFASSAQRDRSPGRKVNQKRNHRGSSPGNDVMPKRKPMPRHHNKRATTRFPKQDSSEMGPKRNLEHNFRQRKSRLRQGQQYHNSQLRGGQLAGEARENKHDRAKMKENLNFLEGADLDKHLKRRKNQKSKSHFPQPHQKHDPLRWVSVQTSGSRSTTSEFVLGRTTRRPRTTDDTYHTGTRLFLLAFNRPPLRRPPPCTCTTNHAMFLFSKHLVSLTVQYINGCAHKKTKAINFVDYQT